MPFLTRLGLIVLPHLGLTACAALAPAVLIPQLAATVGVAGMSAVSCNADPLCEPQAARCADASGKRIEATQSADIGIPSDEGRVATFMPAYWQPQFVSSGTSLADRPLAGTFAITDKSAVFVPPPGMEGVRIPLAAITNVELQMSASTGAPRQMTVESCFGRLDRISFGQQQQPGRLDSEATSAAAAQLKVRVAASQPERNKGAPNAP